MMRFVKVAIGGGGVAGEWWLVMVVGGGDGVGEEVEWGIKNEVKKEGKPLVLV